MNSSVKVYFEEGRTIIVFDNPTDEVNKEIESVFGVSAVDRLSELVSVEREPEPVEIPSESENLIASAKMLLQNNEQMRELGIDKTILMLTAAMNLSISDAENWLDTANNEQKTNCFLSLREKVMKS